MLILISVLVAQKFIKALKQERMCVTLHMIYNRSTYESH